MTLHLKRRLVAIWTFILLLFDTGSDVYVAVDLFLRCHFRYGTSVVTSTLLPGFVFGWIRYFTGSEKGFISFMKALFCPLWFVPCSIWKCFLAAFSTYDESSEAGIKAKK